MKVDGTKTCQVVFLYNEDIKNTIKTINGSSFDVICKKWYIPKTGMNDLIERLEKNGSTTVKIEKEDREFKKSTG